MATAFDRLAATIAADRNVATDAMYGAGGSTVDMVPLRVVLRRPDVVGQFGDSRFLSDSTLADIRIVDAPSLGLGDRIEVGADVFHVRGEPVRDAERMFWTAELRGS